MRSDDYDISRDYINLVPVIANAQVVQESSFMEFGQLNHVSIAVGHPCFNQSQLGGVDEDGRLLMDE